MTFAAPAVASAATANVAQPVRNSVAETNAVHLARNYVVMISAALPIPNFVAANSAAHLARNSVVGSNAARRERKVVATTRVAKGHAAEPIAVPKIIRAAVRTAAAR